MFDISWTEILVIGVVALIAIGPRELPRVLYELGRWVRRLRAMAAEFQRHFSDLMHETELDELRRQAQAAHDLTKPHKLAEMIDPGGTVRYGVDHAVTGATGYPGSPPEPVPPPPVPTVRSVESPAPVTAAPADRAATGGGQG